MSKIPFMPMSMIILMTLSLWMLLVFFTIMSPREGNLTQKSYVEKKKGRSTWPWK